MASGAWSRIAVVSYSRGDSRAMVTRDALPAGSSYPANGFSGSAERAAALLSRRLDGGGWLGSFEVWVSAAVAVAVVLTPVFWGGFSPGSGGAMMA